MQRFFTLVFAVGLVVLLWWIWTGDMETSFFIKGIEKPLEEKVVVTKVPERKGIRRTEKVLVQTPEKEIKMTVEASENGVFLIEINEKEVSQKISSKEVFSLNIEAGMLSFWEIDPESGSLKFKSINLTEFVKTLK